jgi:hypothetical protein
LFHPLVREVGWWFEEIMRGLKALQICCEVMMTKRGEAFLSLFSLQIEVKERERKRNLFTVLFCPAGFIPV